MFILYRALKSLNLFLLVFLLIFSYLLHWRSLYCILFTSCFRCALNLWLALITWYGYTSKNSFSLLDWAWSHLINFFLCSWWYGYIFNINSCFVLWQASVSLLASERVTIWVDYLLLINGCCGMSSSPISLLGCISASNLYIVSSTIAECLQSSIYCITSTIVVLSSALVTRGDFSESVHILYFSFLWWN